MAWTSLDGLTWSPASMPPLPDGVAIDDTHADAWIEDVAATDARLVAVGSIGLGHLDADGSGSVRYASAVWSSADGRTWTRVETDAFAAADEIRGIAAGPRGFVVVGNKYSEGAMVWWSADGLRWTRVDPGQDAFISRAVGTGDPEAGLYLELFAVEALGDGFVAMGGDAWCIYGEWTCTPAAVSIWTSTDGTTWTRVPPLDAFNLGEVGRVTDGTVAVWGGRPVVTATYDTDSVGLWITEVGEP
jgi:hypothetical protein